MVWLTLTEFERLLSEVGPLRKRAHHCFLPRAGRIRRIGVDNTFELHLGQRFLVRLFSSHRSFTVHVLGSLVDLDTASVCRNIHAWLPVLKQASPAPLRSRTLQAKPDEVPVKARRVHDFPDVL